MRILVGEGSCGLAAGAGAVHTRLAEALAQLEKPIALEATGCIGMCYLEPIVEVFDDEGQHTTYVNVDNEAVDQIIAHISGQKRDDSLVIGHDDMEALNKQKKIVLRRCGVINPEKIEDAMAEGAYQTAKKCILSLTPQHVIDEIKASGLRGRGGAGFPTWFKWQAAKNSRSEQKYFVCNADEGDPGAFMDRSVLEGDPHTLIEGMIIGGYAIGASQGIIYVRAEYPLAIKRLQKAIDQAKAKGFLGQAIFGNEAFSFELRIKAGAGAFVCGEETALIASLEGERGMPRLKPPFPAQKGFWQEPTNINNVETLANVPWILQHGGAAFAGYGTAESAGTKVFALTGKIKKGGLVEVPMGMSIRDIIYDIGGGIRGDKAFKAVQMGGPSGGCIPSELADTPVEYAALLKTGAIMGSGGMVVMDETTCMVEMARFFLEFTTRESCGKCIHCRIGTKRMLEILTRITEGAGRSGDIALLESLGQRIKEGSLCGLGQTAPNPVLSTIRYFRNEYVDHIEHGTCTAKQCKSLLTYRVNDNCIGCGVCKRGCPVQAIAGESKEKHLVDQASCIKCGKCAVACRFEAIDIN